MTTATTQALPQALFARGAGKLELACAVPNLGVLRGAVDNGADAVYIPAACTDDACFEWHVDYAQNLGCKVVLMLEDRATPASWETLRKTIEHAAPCVDAVLLSDPALLLYAAAHYPGLPRYLQLTQWVVDEDIVRVTQRHAGIERIVAPRSVFLPRLERLASRLPVEVEVIGFGPDCAFLDDVPIGGPTLASTSDALDLLPRLIDIGIQSVRVEADAGGTNGAANVTRIWREAINAYAAPGPLHLELVS